MLYYINEIMECLDKSEPKSSSTKSSADPLDLFVFDKDCEKISEEKSETFHKLVANILFATKIARSDTGADIFYLTTRVRELDQSDWINMVHLFKYVRGAIDILLIISAYKSGILKWYIYGSHAVHPNMRGHTGVVLTMGRGLPISVSSK